MTQNNELNVDTRVRRIWGAALLALVVFAMWRIGGFDLTSTLDSGRTVPNTYGTVDHPFHASRAATLLESLRNGEILRWMGSHQGGYPVEFYPLGAAWLDVALWAAMLGSISILAVHKLAVAVIFVLPAVAYLLLVRGDHVHPSAAFLAMAFHLAFPGHWLNGGYEELVGWGLITNVAGATLALISTILLARYVLYREHAYGVAAVLTIAAGAVTNPRSLFGVVLATLAIAVWSVISSAPQQTLMQRARHIVVSIGTVGLLSFLIAAPVIVSLLRFNGDYFFLHYEFYDPLDQFIDALETAMSMPVMLLAIGGIILVFVVKRSVNVRVSQTLAIATVFYSLFTIWVATTNNPPPLVEQLEAPRLMPYQRLLMLALAAVFIVIALQRLTAKLPVRWREGAIAIVVLMVGFGSLLAMTNRGEDVPYNEHALYTVTTVGDQRFADMEDAVTAANDLRPAGSSVFVIGNQSEWWHEQLWAPGIEHGTYYYDDWLWYWHIDQPGPYDWRQGYWMQNPTDALNEEYFQQHGISVVMVSDMWVADGVPPRQAAVDHPLLELQGTHGSWDVYTVNVPTSIATRGDAMPASIEWSSHKIEAAFDNSAGPVLVRQNAFPRWEATVNGEPAKITRTDAGYMEIETPDGRAEVILEYETTAMDWVARAMSMSGLVGVVAFGLRGQRLVRTGEGESNAAA